MNDGSIIYLSLGNSVNHIGPRIRYIQQHKSVEPEMIDLPTIFRIGCIGDPEFRLSEKTRLHLIMAYQYERHLVELNKPDHFQRGIHKYGLEIRVDFSEKFYLAFRSGGVEDEIVYNKFMYSPWGFGLKIWKIHIDFAYANVTTYDGTVANTELGISFKSGLNYE